MRPRVSAPDSQPGADEVVVRQTTIVCRLQSRAHRRPRTFSPVNAGAPRLCQGNSDRAAGRLSIAKRFLHHCETRDSESRPISAHTASCRQPELYPPISPPSAEMAVLAAISQRRHSTPSKRPLRAPLGFRFGPPILLAKADCSGAVQVLGAAFRFGPRRQRKCK